MSVGDGNDLLGLRIGVFELDLADCKLRKNGISVKLPPQPFKVLALIATRRGQVVTREEIQQKVWESDTFVDFEQGLNHCVKQIRSALGDSAETPRYVETVPRRGYRFIAPVEVIPRVETPALVEIAAPAETAAPPTPSLAQLRPPSRPQHDDVRWHRRRWLAIAIGVAASLAVAIAAGVILINHGRINKRTIPGPPPDEHSVAVMPFADWSSEGNQKYFSDGLAEELIDALAKTPGLRVTGRMSSFQFKGKNEDIRVIGKKLNVASVLEGSVRKQDNQFRIAVQLIKTDDGFHLWSEVFDREMTDIFTVQREIAQAVAGALRVKLLHQSEVAATNAEAYTAYLQGKYFRGRGNDAANLEKAVTYFEEAITLDPNYAPAWAWLGEARSAQAGASFIPAEEGYRMARKAVERAIELDRNLADAHAVRGEIKMLHDWDWAGADDSYRRAMELKPGDAGRLGILLDLGALARMQGRLDESIALHRRVIEIDPLRPGAYKNLGWVLYYAGDYEAAKAALNKAIELNPDIVFAHYFLAEVYLAQSQPQEALDEAEKEKHPALRLCGLALASHALGRKKESNASLAELVKNPAAESPYQIAEVYAFRGEADQAFTWLKRAYALHDPGLAEMKVDRLLKNLKRDPRYVALLKKMRLAT